MISVVICTRNRARKLEECLHRFGESGFDRGMTWELIVVNNNSEDHTAKVVEGWSQSSDLPIKYVFEERQGLSNARNRGMREARYPLIAFIDDDCLVDPSWFSSILTEFAGHPSLSILGGRVDLANPKDWPVSIRSFDHRVEIVSIGQVLRFVIGCNMVFARRVFDRIGLFDPSLGKGTRAGSAEEIDLIYRALRSGLKIVFSPNVVVYHAHERNSRAVVQKLNAEYVRGRGAFYCKHILRGDLRTMQLACREILASGRLRELATGALFWLRETICPRRQKSFSSASTQATKI